MALIIFNFAVNPFDMFLQSNLIGSFIRACVTLIIFNLFNFVVYPFDVIAHLNLKNGCIRALVTLKILDFSVNPLDVSRNGLLI